MTISGNVDGAVVIQQVNFCSCFIFFYNAEAGSPFNEIAGGLGFFPHRFINLTINFYGYDRSFSRKRFLRNLCRRLANEAYNCEEAEGLLKHVSWFPSRM